MRWADILTVPRVAHISHAPYTSLPLMHLAIVNLAHLHIYARHNKVWKINFPRLETCILWT
jgi:hypothetical protein